MTAVTDALHTETGRLPVTPPFDFSQSLRVLNNFSPAFGEQEATSDTLTKAITIQGQCVAFRVHEAGGSDRPELRHTLFSEERLDEPTRRAVVERIRFFLSLDDNLAPFYAIAEQDEHFAPIVARLHGLHHVKFLTLYEIACWAVLVQHRPIAAARPMKRALVERYGKSITVDGRCYWAFPELEPLLAVGAEEFASVIKSERSAPYLTTVTRGLSTLDERFLRTAPYDEAEQALRSIKGIGAWSATFILLRGLGRMERLLLDMKPFHVALAKVYGPVATMEQMADRYGPHVGYWSYYLRNAA